MIIAQCAICQELLGSASEESLLALFCGHVFHVICAETWLKSSSTCPQCRLPVTRRQIIKRLYFSAVDRASTSLLLPEVTEQTQDEPMLPSASSDDQNAATIALALQKARSEVVRLNNAVAALKKDLATAQNKLNNSENEMKTVSSLYSEVDRLYSAERQKLKQARIELSSYKELLREAEAIKVEGLELRKKMADMQDLQTLIASSEEAANDLLRRYTGDSKATASATCGSPSSDLRTVCRWAAVLRSELTSARAKIQQYRTEAHRLRRMQAAATKRVLTAEARCAEQKERLRHLQSELTTVRSAQCSTPASVAIVSPAISTPSTPQVGGSSTPAESVGLKTCLRYVDMNTPDLDALSWTPKQIEVIAKVSEVTPCMNPFKLTDSPCSTPSARVHTAAASSSSSREDDSRGGCHEESAPHSSRRPSSLLALAIMRNYGAGKSSGNQLYNGLGGHEPSSLAFSSSSRPPLLAQQCLPRVQPKKTSKHKPARATTAHHSVPLDAFLRK